MAKVLVVDDAAFARLSIRKMLEANDHSVAGEASNGIEAVEKFVEVRPDVVLLDISMPEMNGLEALKRIKIIEPNARIIICSALGQQATFAQAIEYGAVNFIVKPFTTEQLIDVIEQTMSLRQ